jgi:hypothetical protein
MITAEGVAAIVDFQHHPFGNSYFPTKECGGTIGSYDSDTRHCWAKACVGVASPPADCFSAPMPVVQHGQSEYEVNKYQACALVATAGEPVTQRYWPFVVCMEKRYEREGANAAKSCAKESSIDYEPLNACYSGPQGDAAVVTQAKATIDHPGTPYLAVNGESVEVNEVLKAVCKAYLGTLPAGCASKANATKA